MQKALLTTTVLLMVALAGCNSAPGGCDPSTIESVEPVAVIETSVGTLCAEIFIEQVPITAQNFLDLAQDGKYDGTFFHRIITDFMMQGGDYENGDGTGGEAADGGAIPDEFHRLLTHDGKGILSMANSGPDSGGSQFFITFTKTPWLDNKHSVFGQVIDGLEVLTKVNQAHASMDGTPVSPVELRKVTIRPPTLPRTSTGGVDFWVPDDENGAAANGPARFAVVLENNDAVYHDLTINLTTQGDIEATLEPGYSSLGLGAGDGRAFIVRATNDADGGTITVNAWSGDEPVAATVLTVTTISTGDQVGLGDEVVAHYIGMTPYGYVFDTSVYAVAQEVADQDRGFDATFNLRHATQYSPFTFTPGSGVIQGFTTLATSLHEMETGVMRIPARDAYGETGRSPLSGWDLIFQLEIIHAERP